MSPHRVHNVKLDGRDVHKMFTNQSHFACASAMKLYLVK